MGVRFQRAVRVSGSGPCTALVLLFGAACSSTPVDSPSDGAPEPVEDATPPGDGSGSPSVTPEYQKVVYPSGPYGVGVGSVIEDFAFLGWRDPVASAYDVERLEEIRLSEFYNPEGTVNDLKLIWINASAVWCTVCRAELKDIDTQDIQASRRSKGLLMIETLFEDNDSLPAKPEHLSKWGTAFNIDFPLLVDPGFKLGTFFSSDATPLNLLVDARTMRIVDATMGYSGSDYWERVDKFLARQ